jgi:hypothetical protein
VCLGSLCQKLGQSDALLLAQAGRRSGGRLVSQTFHSLLSGTLHPLANCPFTDSQGIGYLRLFPALLFELEGALSAYLHASCWPGLITSFP